MKPENQSEESYAPQAQPEAATMTDDQRAEARRKFLRMGAGGSAALVVTVVHKRAFAGKKNGGAVASNCVSLRGTPDLRKADKKKALEASAFGTPNNMVCRPRDEIPPHPGSPTKTAKYSDVNGNRPLVYSSKKFKDGLGELNFTLEHANNYRLYEKGYCPIVYDQNGLRYDTSASYYDKGKHHQCKS
ncbi:MAG: hypothetical protein ACKOF9_09225 [Burkholderiales bacterium]